MCGIAGTLAFERSRSTIDEIFLKAASEQVAHRGPDGAGTWISADRRVGFVHRRLAIIDLSNAAAQPMSNADGTLHITFNGEIYNHAALRRDLENTGRYTWTTDHSDTEVLLHAFAEWGIGCLERLRGMFAFALWDARERSLWLVRDRLGIKPLYYSVNSGRVNFASEIKALLAAADEPRVVDREALYHYLSFLTTPAPQTLFAGIRKIPNGCWVRIDTAGRVEERRYWDVWDHVTPLKGVTDDGLAERLLGELSAAVELHKAGDVPVGIFLSGGIDSSAIAALFARREGSVKTFSIGYDRNYPTYENELDYARNMAIRVGAEHREVVLAEDDLLRFLPDMVRLQDEPIADPVCVPVYYLSKLARDYGVKVCQVGEGADELFCGYPGWLRALDVQRLTALPAPRFVKHALLASIAATRNRYGFPYERLRRAMAGEPVFWSGAEAFTESEKRDLLSPTVCRDLRDLSSWDALQPIYQRFQAKAWECSPLNWMTYSDLNVRLPELLLMRVDKMSMGVGLEARVPYLDHRVVELAMSMPSEAKIRGRVLKRILKRAVRNLVPDELLRRKKQGFGLPIYEWYHGRLGVESQNTVRRVVAQTDLFSPPAVERVLEGGTPNQKWYLLNFALWWEAYVAG